MDKQYRTTEWELKNCDICGEDEEIQILSERTEKAETRTQIFEMEFTDAVCERCGFVFSRSVPPNAFLFDYYKDQFMYESEYTTIEPDYSIENRMETIQQYIETTDRIAEVGANTGKFCEHLRADGYRAEGIDPIDTSSENVSNKFVDIENEWINTYDAVMSYYTLEHVTDANSWLTEITMPLAMDGIVILEVPNFEQYPDESLIHEHFLHFTPGHLRALLRQNGIVPLDVVTTNTSREFGVEIVGKYTGEATMPDGPDRETVLDADFWTVSDAIECYERGQQSKQQRAKLYKEVAAEIERARPSEEAMVYFWAANKYATGIVNELETRRVRIIDNDSSKIETPHSGFPSPIEPPEFEQSADHHRIFVLCSPGWNDDIRRQLEGMDLDDITIIEGTTPPQ